LLLERGGRTVYFGGIGPDSSVVRSYLAQRGAICPPNLNVAEYMLEAIGAGVTARIGSRDWGELWGESREFFETKEEVVRMREEGLKNNPTELAEPASACEFIVPLRRIPPFIDKHGPFISLPPNKSLL
jgi:ATP-binding cassette subfamily G (WHITE) protein 2 (SNQ2)